MKTLVLILSVVFFISCANEKFNNDLAKDKLKGRVSIITESRYDAIEKFGETQKDGLESKYVHKYDINGKVIEYSSYASDGSLLDKDTYKYDDKGNLTEKHSQIESPFLWRDAPVIKYKYDDKGKMIEENQYHLDGSFARKWYYKYDAKGNKVAKSSKENFKTPYEFKNGRVIISGSTTSYEYDKRGNLILEATGMFKDTFQYDNNNNMIVHEDYSCRETYNYDVNGNKLEYKKCKSDGTVESIETFKYDAKGNLIEENEENILGYNNTSKYDDNGLLVEKYSYNKDGKYGDHMNYIYDQFDKTGNWIKKREIGNIISYKNSYGVYVPFITTNIIEREIKYY